MGESALFVGSDTGAFSAGMTQCSENFYDSGFYLMTCNTAGKNIAIRRNGPSANPNRAFFINEVRLYQTTNLLERTGVTISAPAPISPGYAATNLTTHFNRRTPGNNIRALIDKASNTSSWATCFKTSYIQLQNEGHKLIIMIDLGTAYFQHAILVVQDLFNSSQSADMTDPNKFFQNYEIYVGNSPNYADNPKCPNGPHMRTTDTSNYINITYTGYPGPQWKFGKEIWCNMEGRYMAIVADLSHLATQPYEMNLCNLAVFGALYKRTTQVPSTLKVPAGTPYVMEVEKITADETTPIANTLDIMLRQKQGSELPWVSFTQDSSTTKVKIVPNAAVSPGDYTLVIESFDQAGGVFSALKTDTIIIKVLPSDCGRSLGLTKTFETTQPIVLLREYLPTIFFEEQLFSGPHTNPFACGGTYTQSIAINAPLAGVELIDKPSGPNLRPSISIDGTAPADSTFTLTFSGSYSYAPQPLEIKTSFTQTYQIKTVMSVDYLDQPRVIHSLTAADLTFVVPPAAAGAAAPPHFLTASSFLVEYPMKTGLSDALGNTPPAIVPLPFAGFAAVNDLTKRQPSLGTTILLIPQGDLNILGTGFNGNLSSGSITFTCDAWTLAKQGASTPMTLNFVNSLFSAFKASLSIRCSYQTSTAPSFATALPSIVLTASVASTWKLPAVVLGQFPLKQIRFEPDKSLVSTLLFDESARIVSFDGSENIVSLFGTELKVKITLVDDQGNQAPHEQTVSVCPVTASDIEALVGVLSTEPLLLSLTAGKAATTSVSYRSKSNKIVEQLQYSEQKQSVCGAVAFELVTKHQFLGHQSESKSLSLVADQTTGPAFFEDSYLLVKLSSYSFKIPVRVEYTSCSVSRLSFETSALALVYQVGSGSQQTDLPSIVQKPDCGFKFEKLFIKSIESLQLSARIVQTAVKLDLAKHSIDVTTYDESFIGKNATVVVAIEAADVDQKSDMQLQIQFSGVSVEGHTESKQEQTNQPGAVLQSQSIAKSNTPAQATDDPARVVTLEVAKNLGAELGIPDLTVPKVTLEEASIIQTPVSELSIEQLFAEVPLAARMTVGVQNLEQFLSRQRGALTSKAADLIALRKPLPPEVRFEDFNNFGLVELSFTQKINFPETLEQAIREANLPIRQLASHGLIRAKNAIQIFAIKGKEPSEASSDEPIMKYWELVSLRANGVTLKVHFFKPLRVSAGETPDLLIVQLELGDYFDDNGNSLEKSIVKKFEIPTQFASEAEANTVNNIGTSFEATSYSAMILNFVINIIVSGSLSPVWSLVNSLQVVQMNRLFKVNSPGNVNAFTSFFQNIVSVQVFEDLTQLMVDTMLVLPEQDAFSVRFMNAGFASKFFIVNMKQSLFLVALFIGFGLLVALLWPLASCHQRLFSLRQRLIKSLFWNSYIRLLMESYAEVMLFALMNLYAKDWPEGFVSVKADVAVTCVVLATFALLPLTLFLVVWKKYRRHVKNNSQFAERVGSFLEGTSREKRAKPCVLLYTLAFFVRRLALALTLILWEDFFWGQIAVQFAVSTSIIILLQLGRPMETPFANHRETFNEYVTLHFLYLLMSFTPFVPEPETRHSLGTVYIVEVGLFVAVHLAFMTWSKGRSLKMRLRRYCNRKRARATSLARQNRPIKVQSVPAEVNAGSSVLDRNEAQDSQLIVADPHVSSGRPARRPRITDVIQEQERTRAEDNATLKPSAVEGTVILGGDALPKAEQAATADEKHLQQRYQGALTANEIEWLKPEDEENPKQGLSKLPVEKFDERQSDLVMQWPVDVENEFWPQDHDPQTSTPVEKEVSTAQQQKPDAQFRSAATLQNISSPALIPGTRSREEDCSENQDLAHRRLPEFPMKVLPTKNEAAGEKNPDFTLQ